MCAESGSPSEFRENSRAPLKAPASLQIDAFSDPLPGYTANVSQGGMFVEMAKPPPVGSIVKFQVELGFPAGTVKGTAEVVWMRPDSQGAGQPSGIGLQFRYVEEEGEPLLRTAVVQALEKLGPQPESPPPVKEKRPRPPRRPTPPPTETRSSKGRKQRSAKKKQAPKKGKKPADDSKTILGMPAEKAKLIVLLILMAFLLLYVLM